MFALNGQEVNLEDTTITDTTKKVLSDWWERYTPMQDDELMPDQTLIDRIDQEMLQPFRTVIKEWKYDIVTGRRLEFFFPSERGR